MNELAVVPMVASAFILFALGLAHLAITFRGDKLHPRDPALVRTLDQTQLVITRETTLWRAWIGFNASHSFGAMLFGAIYGYLALAHPALLFSDWFLLGVGMSVLAGYAYLGRRYWFSVPYRSILLANALYVAAVAAVVSQA